MTPRTRQAKPHTATVLEVRDDIVGWRCAYGDRWIDMPSVTANSFGLIARM